LSKANKELTKMTRVIRGGRGGSLHVLEKGETANPHGRPRKLVNDIIKDMQDKGVKPVKPVDIVAAFESMLNMSLDELKDIKADEKASYFMRRVAGEMLTGRGYDIIERMLDRAHGKPKQSTDITTGGDKIEFTLPKVIIKTSDESNG